MRLRCPVILHILHRGWRRHYFLLHNGHGVTVMQMDAGLDTGPMIERTPVAIGLRDTAGTLHDRLAAAGAETIVHVLQSLARHGTVPRTAQPEAGATYAGKIQRAAAAFRWTAAAPAVDRMVRAFDPARARTP
jgi:methionyl-tRNA formyltransferase